jgi:hypothetical protein
MATEEKPHRGKGHPALTEDEVLAFIRERGRPVKTSEVAEEFNVSDVGVRKRLKNDFKSVDTMKIRNRRIFFPAFEVDEEDEEEEAEDRAEESDGQTVTMHQMNAKRIGSLFIGIVTAGIVVSQFVDTTAAGVSSAAVAGAALYVLALVLALVVGLGLIGYALWPTLATRSATAEEVSADV